MNSVDVDLVLRQYITNLDDSMAKFVQHMNERLSSITNDLNRCQANYIILEKKVDSAEDS